MSTSRSKKSVLGKRSSHTRNDSSSSSANRSTHKRRNTSKHTNSGKSKDLDPKPVSTSLSVKFRGIIFKIQIADLKTITVAEFKKKFKSYAAKLFSDFHPEYVEDEHLLLQDHQWSRNGYRNNAPLLIERFRDGYSSPLHIEEAIAVFVTVPHEASRHAMFVFPSMTHEHFKYQLYEEMGKKYMDFDVMKDGEVMTNFEDMDELVVRLSNRKRDSQINVKTLTGKTATVPVDLNDTVGAMKWGLRCAEGVPSMQQRLIYAGKQLDDGQRLRDYGIYNNCTVHLVLRLCGS